MNIQIIDSLEHLEMAKLDAEAAIEQWRGAYNNTQLRTMSDGEFEVWKSETKRLWEIAVNAERAYYRALDLAELS